MHVRPTSIILLPCGRGRWTMLTRVTRSNRYPKAMLSVSKTSVPFNFHLTVSRVYEEGDANILDEDEDEGMLAVLYC